MALNIIDKTAAAGFGNKFGSTSDVQGIVLHHTGGGGDIGGVISTFKERGLPAQYVIDQAGTVYQTLPTGAKGQQIVSSNQPGSLNPKLNNSNTIGIEIIGTNDAAWTPAEIAAAQALTAQLTQQNGLPPTAVYGHSELNPKERTNEGVALAQSIRTGQPYSAATAAQPSSGKQGMPTSTETSLSSGGMSPLRQIIEPSTVPTGPYGAESVIQAALSNDPNALRSALYNVMFAAAADGKDVAAQKLGDYFKTVETQAPGAVRALQTALASNPALQAAIPALLAPTLMPMLNQAFAALPPAPGQIPLPNERPGTANPLVPGNTLWQPGGAMPRTFAAGLPTPPLRDAAAAPGDNMGSGGGLWQPGGAMPQTFANGLARPNLAPNALATAGGFSSPTAAPTNTNPNDWFVSPSVANGARIAGAYYAADQNRPSGAFQGMDATGLPLSPPTTLPPGTFQGMDATPPNTFGGWRATGSPNGLSTAAAGAINFPPSTPYGSTSPNFGAGSPAAAPGVNSYGGWRATGSPLALGQTPAPNALSEASTPDAMGSNGTMWQPGGGMPQTYATGLARPNLRPGDANLPTYSPTPTRAATPTYAQSTPEPTQNTSFDYGYGGMGTAYTDNPGFAAFVGG